MKNNEIKSRAKSLLIIATIVSITAFSCISFATDVNVSGENAVKVEQKVDNVKKKNKKRGCKKENLSGDTMAKQKITKPEKKGEKVTGDKTQKKPNKPVKSRNDKTVST